MDGRTDVFSGRRMAAGLAGMLRQIAGMPDYAAHLEHLRRHHPLHEIPDERQFYADFLKARYGDGPTRCC
jgi:uncharacterized short protein YbdD (DUF466 family)